MGAAIARSVITSESLPATSVSIIERDVQRGRELKEELQCLVYNQLEDVSAPADVIVLAVKPQQSKEVCDQLSRSLHPHQLIISIMAGVPLATLRSILADHPHIVRCMPNMPLKLSAGMSVLSAAAQCEVRLVERAQQIFQAGGSAFVVQDESLLDAATAVSGSGPAYVYYLFDHWCRNAVALGFSEEQAHLLVSMTMHGALQMIEQSGDSPSELCRQVCSKGGTTERAIAAFDEQDLPAAFRAGMRASYERSKELLLG